MIRKCERCGNVTKVKLHKKYDEEKEEYIDEMVFLCKNCKDALDIHYAIGNLVRWEFEKFRKIDEKDGEEE